MAETNLTEENFEVAVICALEVEGGAVLNVFDSQYKHSNHLKSLNNESSFTLSFGRIGEQNVVLSWLSIKGKVEAALAAQELRKTFKKVKDVFVVGVCGGVPQKNTELVLGDVVISTEIWGYDSGKQIDKHFERTGELLKLGRKRRSFVNMQGADGNREALQRRVCQILEDKIAESEAGQAETKGASYPGVHKDYLYKPTHHHRHAAPCCVGPDGNCKEARLADCAQLGCGEKPGELIARKRLNPTLPPPNPAIHFGPVASGDIVMKSGEERDKIAAEHQILAFEMEGVGVWDRKWELFVIKGITDYADSHKNKGWQKYAAYTAAAAFRAFLEALQAEKPKKLDTMLDKIAAPSLAANMTRVSHGGTRVRAALGSIARSEHVKSSNGDIRAQLTAGQGKPLEPSVDHEIEHEIKPAPKGRKKLFPYPVISEKECEPEAAAMDPHFVKACENGDLDAMKRLFDTGLIDLDALNQDGMNMLHLTLGTALLDNDSKMKMIADRVEKLCTLGAKVNAEDRAGRRPIHYCAITMNHEAVLCLLKHGADINLPDAKGHTALRYLAMDGDANIGLMDLLVRKGGTLGQKPLLTLPNTNKEHRTAVKRLLRRV